ncbi:MAG: hypothetical protein NVS4B7_09980 [Ktedonobacteraceae bacterium]
MHCKKVCLVVDLREGQNMAQITNMIAVMSAAGWKTDIALKEYGGESMQLARKAVEQDYDLVLAYGGDGTLNQVVNGVMSAKGKSIVGVIPGGTANEWAGEISLPGDHVKAALTLVNSNARDVDLGHVEVQALTFPGNTAQSAQKQKKDSKKKKLSAGAKQYFLLMAGLGIDAAVIAHTSKSLKYHMGRVAFDVAAVKELPQQKPFPIEIRASSNGGEPETHWQGEAIQVIVANTRRYANLIEITPDAYLDDGLLDVCVITEATNPLTTVEQITSLLLRRKPDSGTSKFFRGAHLSLCVPASILMHLDGSAVELKDYLSKAEREALQQVADLHQVMVNYQFDAEAHALQIAIPRIYDNTLFLHPQPTAAITQKKQAKNGVQQQTVVQSGAKQQQPIENAGAVLEHGSKVTVIGVTPRPDKIETYIIAGNMHKPQTDDLLPVAVRIDGTVTVMKGNAEHVERVPAESVEQLQEGTDIVVEGKTSKRGVIRATHVVI